MSRYIDADALIRKYIDTDIEKFSNSDVKIVLENLKQNILKAPSIDIVRCKECKHWERLNYAAPKEGWCDGQMQMPYFEGRWVDADDFCSHGEKRKP